MLEKIGRPGFETLSRPDPVVLRLAALAVAANPAPVYYEVGVGIGATTSGVARILANRGLILLFSRESDVIELANDLRILGYNNLDDRWGSPGQIYSGYHFELARGFVTKELPTFDLAYLDGGHALHLDAPAAQVLKELCRPGGHIVFDDWDWTLGRSPTLNPTVRPETAREFDPGQIAAAHVQLVCALVMDTDLRFECLGIEGNSAIYRRRSEDSSPTR